MQYELAYMVIYNVLAYNMCQHTTYVNMQYVIAHNMSFFIFVTTSQCCFQFPHVCIYLFNFYYIILGDAEEKAQMIFNMYDVKKQGYLSTADFSKMLK